MNLLLIAPIVIPLITAVVALLVSPWQVVQRIVGLIGAVMLLAAGIGLLTTVWQEGIQVAFVGGWPAPYGITLVADLLGAVLVVLAGLTGLAVSIYSLVTIDAPREAFGYYPLLHVLLVGVCGAFITGDLFNLYVWFEVMLIASFVLMTLGGERGQMEGAIKYVTLNLISSAIFLAAVGITYGVTGTLNLADLSLRLNGATSPALATTLAMLFLVAFGIKAAAFPLFFWLPASYHTPPAPVTAIFAGLLTNVGVYSLIRVFTLLFVQDTNYTHTIILVIAGLTMATGVLGALAQSEVRRIISFQIISQVGFMLMGLGIFSPLALTGTVFYIVQDIIVKTNLFLVSGAVYRLQGSYALKNLGGLYQSSPGLAVLFLIPALSLAGIPPLSGFFGKLILVQAGLQVGQYAIVATSLAVSLLTLYSMTRIWSQAFWKPFPNDAGGSFVADGATDDRYHYSETRTVLLPGALVLPMVVLAALTVGIGLAADPVLSLATRAAEQLLNPSEYVRAVLGGRP